MTRRHKITWSSVFIVAILAGLVFGANGPYPAVGLYWFDNADPTLAAGMAAPLNQLLVRTDLPSLYYKSGAANTAWTKIGSVSSGGTVTSITCSAGLLCTPNPILTVGTVRIADQFNVPNEDFITLAPGSHNDLDIWSGGPHVSRVEVDLSGASATITGIVAGVDGDFLYLWNGGGGGTNPATVTLVNDSLSSAALNRIWVADGKSVNIPNNDGILLIYDGGFGWTVFGGATTIVRAQQLSLEPAVTPAALANGSTTNDYNPWAGASVNSNVKQDTGLTSTITGLAAPGAPNPEGRLVSFQNISTTGTITFTCSDPASAGPNQIACATQVVLTPRTSVLLEYDSTSLDWRVLSAPSKAVAVVGNPWASNASDATCTFDGVANPVCGATLSGSTYTLTRDVSASVASITGGVTISEFGFRFFDRGTLTVPSGIATIHNNGGNASGITGGAASRNGGGFIVNPNTNVGGNGGTTGLGQAGGGGAPSGTAIGEWPSAPGHLNGVSGVSSGDCGAGGNGQGNGGASGSITTAGVNRGATTITALLRGVGEGSVGVTYSAGCSGGGGGSSVGTCVAGGGGGGGGWTIVAFHDLAGAGTLVVSADGGNGANATAGTNNCGGGGGGGGGVVTVIYSTTAGATLTTHANAGAGGTATNAGVAGGNGFAGSVFKFNLSGDGT